MEVSWARTRGAVNAQLTGTAKNNFRHNGNNALCTDGSTTSSLGMRIENTVTGKASVPFPRDRTMDPAFATHA